MINTWIELAQGIGSDVHLGSNGLTEINGEMAQELAELTSDALVSTCDGERLEISKKQIAAQLKSLMALTSGMRGVHSDIVALKCNRAKRVRVPQLVTERLEAIMHSVTNGWNACIAMQGEHLDPVVFQGYLEFAATWMG